MRDYSNGGFFFIDAAPIIAAGEKGLKIDGIFEDAKRAVEGGKLVVVTNFPIEQTINSGMPVMIVAEGTLPDITGFIVNGNGETLFEITPEDYIVVAS